MSSIYPWIYVDYTNNIWKISLNDTKELNYKVMYSEGKWTKETLIDSEVTGFAIFVEEDETIHIAYSNSKRDIRYCTMRNKQWVGKTLYHMESDEFEIQELKVVILGEEMHILFMLISDDGSDHGVLMHCRWNGKDVRVNTIQDVILMHDLKEHYTVQVREKNSLDIIFITDEDDEATLKYCNFQKNRWSPVKRLYGIQGDKIQIEVLNNQHEINILNKYRENSTYLLDHVSLDAAGNIQEYRIYENSKETVEPLLFIESNSLYSCWQEEGKIFYSSFDGEKWTKPSYADSTDEFPLQRYNCFIYSENADEVRAKAAYGTREPDLAIFDPNQFIRSILDISENQTDISISKNQNEFQIIKMELQKIKEEKKNLEKKLASFNIQLQKKQRFIDEYEDSIEKVIEQKRKIEENCNVYLEVQKNIQGELEQTQKQLSDQMVFNDELKNKYHYFYKSFFSLFSSSFL